MNNTTGRNKMKMDITERLFFDNEVKTNKMGTTAMMVLNTLSLGFALYMVITQVESQYFWGPKIQIIACAIVYVLGIVISQLGFENPACKKLVISGLIFMGGVDYLLYPMSTVFILFGPTMVSIKYYEPKFTARVTGITWIAYTIALLLNAVLDHYVPSIHSIHIYQGIVIWNSARSIVIYYLIPRTFIYIIEGVISYRIAKAGRNMVLAQASATSRAMLLKSELATAADIQKRSMPETSFATDDGNIDINAYIKPAKDVGGDFYDYFMINDHLLVTVIADVSDKGLGASMFAIEARSYIRYAFSEGLEKNSEGCIEHISLERCVNAVNRQLSINNKEGMFVTMWVACIDTRTGVGKFVNAGHNMPYIRRANGVLKRIENEPQVFMGSFENVTLETNVLRLRNGDTLVLYTDGVTDARNTEDEVFGAERLEKVIKEGTIYEGMSRSECILQSVSEAVENHIADAEQFDDITILTMGYNIDKEIRIEAWTAIANDGFAEDTINRVNEIVDTLDCSEYERRNLDVVIDEICANITMYAYEGKEETVEIDTHSGQNYIAIRFIDSGIPFNPLEAPAPDIGGEPQIGGLGIYLVKNLVDKMDYTYKDGKNILIVHDIWNM